MHDLPAGAGKSSFDLIDAEKFFKAVHLSSGMTILDLACGAGNYTLALARRLGDADGAGRVIAVDLWEEGIALLKESAVNIPSVSIETHVAECGTTGSTSGVPRFAKPERRRALDSRNISCNAKALLLSNFWWSLPSLES